MCPGITDDIGRGHLSFAHLAGAICRKWRTFLCYRTSDGIHIALQIPLSLPPDLSHSVAKRVPSPSRKSRSASTGHASRVRFVSPAFPLLRWFSAIAGPEGANNLAGECLSAGFRSV